MFKNQKQMSKALVLLLLAGFIAGILCLGPVQLSAGVGAAWGPQHQFVLRCDNNCWVFSFLYARVAEISDY